MGCHTWFFKKLEKPNLSLEELKIEILNYIDNDSIPFYKKELLKENSIYIKEELEHDLNWIIEHKETIKNSNNEILILESYYGFKNIHYTLYNNKFYENTEYHDIFRYKEYDATPLTSLEETLELIKQYDCCGNMYMNNDGVLIKEEINFNLLKEFWTKHPDGIIEFG